MIDSISVLTQSYLALHKDAEYTLQTNPDLPTAQRKQLQQLIESLNEWAVMKLQTQSRNDKRSGTGGAA